MGGRAFQIWALTAGAVALVWLAIAAVCGFDLGGPTGYLVGCAIVFATGRVLAKRGDPHMAWLWRHARTARRQFTVDRPTSNLFDELTALAARKRRWVVAARSDDDGKIEITTGTTAFSWKKKIDISARLGASGTEVTVTSASPQLYDWGEGRRVVAEIERALER